MIKIIISGDIGAGKSTLIQRLLRLNGKSLFGFITKKCLPDETGMCKVYMHPIGQERQYSKENLIGECNAVYSIKYPEVFDTLGVRLVNCDAGGLLVMDELGFMENDAPDFQKAVLRALDNQDISVLAAAKSRDTDFLRKVKQHSGVYHFELKQETRESVFSDISKLLC